MGWVRAVGGVVMLSLFGCSWLLEDPVRKPRPRAAAVSLHSHPWTWKDERGRPVAFGKWRGGDMVVATVFTTCRMTCPRTVHRMRQLEAALARKGRSAQFLLVTLDPVADTPERLLRFKQSERLPDSWHLLAGTLDQTRQLTDFLDVHVMDADQHIMHEARIVLFDAAGMEAGSVDGWEGDEPQIGSSGAFGSTPSGRVNPPRAPTSTAP